MLHPPAVVNAILTDTTTIGLVDQMYLYEELTKFVQKLPAGEPVAIFCRAGQMTLLLQGFTSDHALLMKAIRKAIPHFQEPDAEYASDYETVQQVAFHMSQVPGRKNILWFTGGERLFLEMNPRGGLDLPSEPDWQYICDLLEPERIALYPIDARGLTVGGGRAMREQQLLMWQDAGATGGQAWYNTNGFAQATDHILATDGDYCTLTYAPDDLRNNGRWHGVEIKLREAGYRLSHRRGYFDDGRNGRSPTVQTRIALEANGKTRKVLDDRSEPIPFTVRMAGIAPLAEAAPVRAGQVKAPKRGELPYVIV
jgi:VWFA-related protein